jgi:hypothetical protein
MVRFASVRHPEDRGDKIVPTSGACFTNVDAEYAQNAGAEQMLSEALAAAEDANRAKTVFLSKYEHMRSAPR